MKGILAILIVGLMVAACTPQPTTVTPSTAPPTSAPQTSSPPGLMDAIIIPAGTMRWVPAPASLPEGADIAVLEGDLTKAEPFAFRLKVPTGYTIAPHRHPAIEHVTMISGAVRFGMGESLDKDAARVLPAGSFAAFPANDAMYAIAVEDSVIQVHGMGPWGITYVNPADDPRN